MPCIKGNVDDNVNILDSMLTFYNNKNYHIFIGTNQNTTCFLCKEWGHVAKNCSAVPETTNTNDKINITIKKNQISNKIITWQIFSLSRPSPTRINVRLQHPLYQTPRTSLIQIVNPNMNKINKFKHTKAISHVNTTISKKYIKFSDEKIKQIITHVTADVTSL